MDFRISKKSIKELFKGIVSVLRETISLPNFWFYIAMAIFLTTIFIVINFPYEVLIRNQLQEFGSSIGRGLYVKNVDFRLTNPTNIDDIVLILNDESEVNFEDIIIDISYFKALFNKTLKGSIIIRNVKYSKDRTSLNGIVRSNFILDFDSFSDYPSKGSITLQLQNFVINGLNVKGLDISVKPTSIKADARISKKRIDIKNITLSGSELSGNIRGFIILSKFTKYSQINLDMEIDSSSPLLEGYKIFLGGMLDKEDKIKMSVSGTLANPDINLHNNLNNLTE